MAITRIYTGADGLTHSEPLKLMPEPRRRYEEALRLGGWVGAGLALRWARQAVPHRHQSKKGLRPLVKRKLLCQPSGDKTR